MGNLSNIESFFFTVDNVRITKVDHNSNMIKRGIKSLFLASACLALPCSALDMLEPEAMDNLATTLANMIGAEFSTHVSLEDLEVKAEDVYILPNPPNLEASLSALNGFALSRQPAPFDSGIEKLDIAAYQAAQTRIAEAKPQQARALEHVSYAMKPPAKGLTAFYVERLPPIYQTYIYLIPLGIVSLLMLPISIFGLRYAKGQKYVGRTLTILTAYGVLSFLLVLFVNIFPIPSLIGCPLAFFLAALASLYALRSMDSIAFYRDISLFIPLMKPIIKEPLGWAASVNFFLIVANILLLAISSFFSVRFGILGLLTSNQIIAGILYFILLTAFTIIGFSTLSRSKVETKKIQCCVIAMLCAYAAVATLAILFNIVAMIAGSGMFVALDPVSFFQVSNPIEFNVATNIFICLYFVMWIAGYFMQLDLDQNTSEGASSFPSNRETNITLPRFELQ